MKLNLEPNWKTIFFKSFIGGLGWMIGITVGFAIFIAIFSLLLNWLGGLPVVGDFFAQIINLTNQALQKRQI